jgi:hypothetical protein
MIALRRDARRELEARLLACRGSSAESLAHGLLPPVENVSFEVRRRRRAARSRSASWRAAGSRNLADLAPSGRSRRARRRTPTGTACSRRSRRRHSGITRRCTSTVPYSACGQRCGMSIVSSRPAASTIQEAPRISLVSANGPSVTNAVPSRMRTLAPANGAARARSIFFKRYMSARESLPLPRRRPRGPRRWCADGIHPRPSISCSCAPPWPSRPDCRRVPPDT